jgi:ankyrin repeat protein
VYCQVVYICGLIPARIRRALAELPETLDETYQRTLREIRKAEWEITHRLFQFVAVASRPLLVKELAELLAFDFEAGPIPRFYEDWRLEDPVDAVLSACSSLLAIVDDEYFGAVIQFSHFSVREFLTSARLASASDIILRRYHLSMTPAHTLAAQACLGILLHLDKDVITRDSLDELPLAQYAAEHWVDHALFEDVSQNVEDGMKQLFDPKKSHLAVCVWIHDPDPRPWEVDEEDPRPSLHRRTPLHYAALWGLHFAVEFLAIEHAQDVHSRCSTDNATPLHLAVERRHVKVARFLLECGADVTAQNEKGSTPLHVASEQGNLEVASVLVERGADVTAQNKERSTPLHLASRWGNLKVASMLVERGADVTAQDKEGWTPLHLASQWGIPEVASMLVERGADVTAQDKERSTPLHLVSRWGNLEVATMLVERGAYMTAQNEQGWTPLHLASEWGNLEVASMLVERGADVTAQDKEGSTPLHLASRWGQLEVATMLVERGADSTAQDKDGSTPLHLASTRPYWDQGPQQGRADIACILLRHGADVTAQDKDGRTPLDLASSDQGEESDRSVEVKEVVHVILQHVADRVSHKNIN